MKSENARVAKVMLSKLDRLAILTPEERSSVLSLDFEEQNLLQNRYICREGDLIRGPFVVLEGHVLCQKVAMSGNRQIVSLHREADIIGLQSLVASNIDYSVQTANKSVIAWISAQDLNKLLENSPNILKAFAVDMLLEAAVSREWLLNAATRDAESRVAHFFAEFYARAEIAGEKFSSETYLPFTQEQVGDATGLTAVHVNRMLQNLKKLGVLTSSDGHYLTPNRRKLELAAGFNREYLQTPTRMPAIH